MNVIFADGTQGKRCADQRDDKWDCPGHYQTTQCEMGYTCDHTYYTCKEAGKGEGDPKEVCEASCEKSKPADVFMCNASTYQCYNVPPNETNQGSEEACNEHCQIQYTCDKETFTCKQAEVGDPAGQSKEKCDTDCVKPPPVYKCNEAGGGIPGNFSCEEVPAGTEGAVSQDECAQKCHSIPPEPITPPELKNPKFWRGNQINKGYMTGEWDFDFTETGVTMTYGDSGAVKDTFHANVKQSGAGGKLVVWFEFTDGKSKGKVMKGLLKLGPNGPETLNAVLAFGAPAEEEAATVPASIAAAMEGDGHSVFVLSACESATHPNCKFAAPSWRLLSDSLSAQAAEAHRRLEASNLTTADACNQYTTCKDCTAHYKDTCGWCSVPVQYQDGSPGFQCAGSGHPFVCPAFFKRTDCGDYLCDPETFTCREAGVGEEGKMTEPECNAECVKPPEDKKYICDPATFTCKEHDAGTLGFEECNASCKPPEKLMKCDTSTFECKEVAEGEEGGIPESVCKQQCIVPPPPSNETNVTPVELEGTWRGIGIQNGYTLGEWDVVFTNVSATFRDSKASVWKAKVTVGGTLGSDLNLTPETGENAGKAIHCKFATQQGEVVKRMTLAMGLPGTDAAPTSYEDAMTTAGGFKVLFLVKCGEGAASCDFSASAPH
eukprot:COSAG05_NODE_1097_length_5894_cov_2.299741_1_plen_661_part_00